MLRAAGPQQWVWEECRDLNAMQFRFKDKERPQGYVCSLAGHLHDYSIEVRLRYNVSSFYAFLVLFMTQKVGTAIEYQHLSFCFLS
jgi:hypothetical protein